MYEEAGVYRTAEAFLRELLAKTPTPDQSLRDRVDRILTNLVTEFDAEEEPLRRKLDEYQAILDHGGDLELAGQASAAARQARSQHVDFLGLLTNAAFYPETSNISVGTQQLAVALARDWISGACDQLAEANLAARPQEVPVRIENWTGDLAAGTPLPKMESRLRAKIKAQGEKLAEEVKPSPGTYGAFWFAAITLLIAIVTFAHAAVGAGVVILLLTAGGVWAGVAGIRNIEVRQEEIREQARATAETAASTLRQATAEYVDVIWGWQHRRAALGLLGDYLATISPENFLTRPTDQIREVL
jgi:hypothetical protein